jgi:hypothetical protein
VSEQKTLEIRESDESAGAAHRITSIDDSAGHEGATLALWRGTNIPAVGNQTI